MLNTKAFYISLSERTSATPLF